MGHNKSNSEREIYSTKCLQSKRRKYSNQYLKTHFKKLKNKSKLNSKQLEGKK